MPSHHSIKATQSMLSGLHLRSDSMSHLPGGRGGGGGGREGGRFEHGRWLLLDRATVCANNNVIYVNSAHMFANFSSSYSVREQCT